MYTKNRFILTFLLACAPMALHAQTPAASAPPAAGASPAAAESPSRQMVPNAPPGASGFSADDAQRLRAARTKALQDPSVQAALVKERDAAEALRAAMLADDKSLQPILDKLPAPSTSGTASAAARQMLTPEERQKILAEREKLKGTPAADQMQKAVLDFRTALRQAIQTADPTLVPLLDRIDAANHSAQAGGAKP